MFGGNGDRVPQVQRNLYVFGVPGQLAARRWRAAGNSQGRQPLVRVAPQSKAPGSSDFRGVVDLAAAARRPRL